MFFLLQEIVNGDESDIGDTSSIRKSLCGLELMEEGEKGVYIGPKDGQDQTDVFVTEDSTHLKIHFYELQRCIELSRETSNFILDTTSIIRVTNSEVPREMIDIRVWYKNCVGRWTPTRRGVRLHYIHFNNVITLMEKMCKPQ